MTPDAAHHFLVLSYVTLGTIFAICAMRTFAAARRGRRRSAGDGVLQADVSEIKTRLIAVETLLRDVG